jgi:hypothetical protein
LCKTFKNSDRADLKGFWCDGVSWQTYNDNQLHQKSVNDTKKIVTTGWIGTNGQQEYQMTIHFGKIALRHYAKGTSLIDAIPDATKTDWLTVDPENKAIEIQLL